MQKCFYILDLISDVVTLQIEEFLFGTAEKQ